MPRIHPGYAALSLAYMGAILYGALLPGAATGPNTPVWSLLTNALHIPVFAGLGFCLILTFWAWPNPFRDASVLGLGLLNGMADEWVQSAAPDRMASFVDIGLDLAGLVAVVLVSRRWRRSM